MELDSFCYPDYGEYKLDEVTIVLDPIFGYVDDKIKTIV